MAWKAWIIGVVCFAVSVHFAESAVASLRWCTISTHEEQKCVDMKEAFSNKDLKTLECVAGESARHCMELISTNLADLITLDGGDVYVAGEKFNMIPIMQEVYKGDSEGYYAIAVVKRSNTGFNLNTLRGKNSCHTGVRKTAGWNVPIGYLLEKDFIEVMDCQDDIRAAGNFFNASCAPGALSDNYNPHGDNPESLCALCQTTTPVRCPRNSAEPYYNYAGAFSCMVDGAGDVAFIKPVTITENTGGATSLRPEDFQLLCQDGTRADVGQHENCNLAFVPSHAVMASKNFEDEVLQDFRSVLNQAQGLFGMDTNTNGFSMFNSTLYGGSKDLLFKDSTQSLADVVDKEYTEFLGNDYLGTLKGLEKCPENSLRWCVTSAQEKSKCRAMSTAFTGANLVPKVSCYESNSDDECAKEIAGDAADLVTLDGGKLFRHGRVGLVAPVMAEDYGEGDATYWGVAVVKRTSSFTINELKGKKSCHTGYLRTTGWKVPIGFLIERGYISVDNKCDVPKAVGEFFSQSCVPDVLKESNNPYGTNPSNLCDLCIGEGSNKCTGTVAEPYAGYNGAFRCLVEDAGDVAFVKHKTVGDNTDGSGTQPWNRGLQKSDYQLLCPDGSRAEVDDYLSCTLAKVPSHTVVTATTKTAAQRQEMVTLLTNAQDQFKSDTGTVFKMFDSDGYGPNSGNLIFKDSAVQLLTTGDSYDKFLSKEYRQELEAIYCEAPTPTPGHSASLLPSSLVMLVAMVMHRIARG